MSEQESEVIPVAVGLIEHGGRYLVGRRGPGGPLAGFHEFPGGKCQRGEPPHECVVRECREETGLHVQVVRLRRRTSHTYPYGTVELFFYDCQVVGDGAKGPPAGNFFWASPADLRRLNFPEPNGPLIDELVQ